MERRTRPAYNRSGWRAGNRFREPLDLQLAKDFLIVPFHRFQGEDKPLANLLNGLVEGKANKLKLIKRMGYGRAGFALLRQRVLHAL
jgi:hypothetical protein